MGLNNTRQLGSSIFPPLPPSALRAQSCNYLREEGGQATARYISRVVESGFEILKFSLNWEEV